MDAEFCYEGTSAKILSWVKKLQDEIMKNTVEIYSGGCAVTRAELPLCEGISIKARYSEDDI